MVLTRPTSLPRESPGRSRTGRKGFSLIEVVLVVVLLSALAALAVPMFDSMLSKASAESISQQIAAAIKEAGAEAASKGEAILVALEHEESKGWALTAERFPITTAPLLDSRGLAVQPRESRVLIRFSRDTEFLSGTTGPVAANVIDSPLHVCMLWPSGGALPLADVVVRAGGERGLRLRVGALTGQCRVLEDEPRPDSTAADDRSSQRVDPDGAHVQDTGPGTDSAAFSPLRVGPPSREAR